MVQRVLTEGDKGVVAKLARRERAWRHNRWYCVLVGGLGIGIGVWLVGLFFELASRTQVWDGGIVWLCPVAWGMCFQSAWILVHALAKWHGDPVIAVLLKLAEADVAEAR
jgi:hypothetical protein